MQDHGDTAMQEVGREHPGGGQVRGWSRGGGGRVSHPTPVSLSWGSHTYLTRPIR